MAEQKSLVATLVAMMPESDSPGKESTFTGPTWAVAEPILAEILEGGRDNLIELIGMVGDHSDYKPTYALHAIAIAVGRPGRETERRLFTETLAGEIRNENLPTALRAFLIRELQVAGGPEVVATLATFLGDAELCETATQALLAVKAGAAEHLRTALPQATGKNRVTLIQALGVLGCAESVAALAEAARDQDRGVRIAAAAALAASGAPEAVEALCAAANAEAGWERIQATKACLVLAEKLLAAGKKAEAVKVYAYLRDSRSGEDERYVREVARKALDAAESR
jgi:hypothetical protein